MLTGFKPLGFQPIIHLIEKLLACLWPLLPLAVDGLKTPSYGFLLAVLWRRLSEADEETAFEISLREMRFVPR